MNIPVPPWMSVGSRRSKASTPCSSLPVESPVPQWAQQDPSRVCVRRRKIQWRPWLRKYVD